MDRRDSFFFGHRIGRPVVCYNFNFKFMFFFSYMTLDLVQNSEKRLRGSALLGLEKNE